MVLEAPLTDAPDDLAAFKQSWKKDQADLNDAVKNSPSADPTAVALARLVSQSVTEDDVKVLKRVFSEQKDADNSINNDPAMQKLLRDGTAKDFNTLFDMNKLADFATGLKAFVDQSERDLANGHTNDGDAIGRLAKAATPSLTEPTVRDVSGAASRYMNSLKTDMAPGECGLLAMSFNESTVKGLPTQGVVATFDKAGLIATDSTWLQDDETKITMAQLVDKDAKSMDDVAPAGGSSYKAAVRKTSGPECKR